MNATDPLSALPPVWARATGVVMILLAGVLGGVLGNLIASALCTGTCGLQRGVGILFGSVAAAIGMSVVTVLALRAMGEWERDQ